MISSRILSREGGWARLNDRMAKFRGLPRSMVVGRLEVDHEAIKGAFDYDSEGGIRL